MVPVPARWTRGMGEHVRVAALPGLFVLFPRGCSTTPRPTRRTVRASPSPSVLTWGAKSAAAVPHRARLPASYGSVRI